MMVRYLLKWPRMHTVLGTPDSMKSIVYFDESAHSPMIEENEAFNHTIVNFVNKYR
jgi:hypothetical protein